jgi:S1-C subfamily serine protease
LAFLAISLPNFPYLFSDKLKFIDQSIALKDDEIVRMCRPAVVSIETVVKNDSSALEIHSGTGFNISPQGEIITNKHVVADAGSITVKFADGRKYSPQEYKTAPNADIAVIELGAKDLPTMALNREDWVQEGDMVTIIGNPLGYEFISQKGQVGKFHKTTEDQALVFDIDITVNPGNSGSPVINDQGKVTGVIFASASLEVDGQKESRALAIPVQSIPEEY